MAIGRVLLIMFVIGCHAGAGPVIAFNARGVRLGAEASAGLGPAGFTAGGSTSVTSDEPRRFFVTFDPALGSPITDRGGDRYEGFMVVGATIGYSSNDGGGNHWATGVWGALAALRDPCNREAPAYSVAFGLRVLGGVHEWFIAPKVNAIGFPCED